MTEYVCFKRKDWDYFCSKINFGASAMDADAIRIMNELRIEELDDNN